MPKSRLRVAAAVSSDVMNLVIRAKHAETPQVPPDVDRQFV